MIRYWQNVYLQGIIPKFKRQELQHIEIYTDWQPQIPKWKRKVGRDSLVSFLRLVRLAMLARFIRLVRLVKFVGLVRLVRLG